MPNDLHAHDVPVEERAPGSLPGRVRLGGVEKDGALCLILKSDNPWQGKLCLEGPRGLGRAAVLDWARINEMPAWYVIQPRKNHTVQINGEEQEARQGEALISGYGIEVEPGESLSIRVEPQETGDSR